MSISRVIGRPLYVGCDAISKLRKMPNCFGIDSMSHLAQRVLHIIEQSYAHQHIEAPRLVSALFFLSEARNVISKVVTVPKTWQELAKSMENVPQDWDALKLACTQHKVESLMACLRGVSNLTGAVSKTIGLVEYAQKLKLHQIPSEIPYLGAVAAKMGESRVFGMVGNLGIKRLKTPLSYFTSGVRIVIHVATFVQDSRLTKKPLIVPSLGSELTEHQKKVNAEREKNNLKKDYAIHNCFFRCMGEIGKTFFIYFGTAYTATLVASPLLAAGLVFSVIQISGALFDIYCCNPKTKVINFPAWLQ